MREAKTSETLPTIDAALIARLYTCERASPISELLGRVFKTFLSRIVTRY